MQRSLLFLTLLACFGFDVGVWSCISGISTFSALPSQARRAAFTVPVVPFGLGVVEKVDPEIFLLSAETAESALSFLFAVV